MDLGKSLSSDGCFPPYNEGASKHTFRERIILTISIIFITTSVVVLSLRKSRNELSSSFNFRRHFMSWYDTSTQTGEITCLSGIKVTVMLVIFAFHYFAINFSNLDPKLATNKSRREAKYLMSKFFGRIIVDIFLVIGAILATRSNLKYLRRGNYNYIQSVISRYFRIVLMIGFILLINALIRSLRDNYDWYDAACQRWWWKTMLLVQNLFVDVEKEHLCAVWLWYAATDFHCYVLTPPLTYLLWKFKQKTVPLCVLIVILGLSYRFFVIKSLGTEWIKGNSYDDFFMAQKIDLISMQTSTRFTSYIIGIIFGFYIDRMEDKKQSLDGTSKLLISLFWTVTFSMIFFVLIVCFTEVILLVPDNIAFTFFPFVDVAYKLLASISVGWTVLACHFGYGGILNRIFSCGFFKIASKLVLGVYLIHCIVIVAFVKIKTGYSTSQLDEMATEMAVELIISALFATFLYIFIESPMNELVSKLLKMSLLIPSHTSSKLQHKANGTQRSKNLI